MQPGLLGHLAEGLQFFVIGQLPVQTTFAFDFLTFLPVSAKAEVENRVKANIPINTFFIYDILSFKNYFRCH
jgi:hypothetical protein